MKRENALSRLESWAQDCEGADLPDSAAFFRAMADAHAKGEPIGDGDVMRMVYEPGWARR